jgi:hypothetical protein
MKKCASKVCSEVAVETSVHPVLEHLYASVPRHLEPTPKRQASSKIDATAARFLETGIALVQRLTSSVLSITIEITEGQITAP